MKFVSKNQSVKFSNSETCIAFEYPTGDKDVNCASIEVMGRYPMEGRAMNLKFKELCFVVRGAGKIVIEGKETMLADGDLVMIEPNEKYYWDGNLTMVVTCAPVWSAEDHLMVE